MSYTLDDDGDDWVVLMDGNRYAGSACIEGTSGEWVAIARGILSGEGESFKRCAAIPRKDGGFVFYSPRNTYGREEEPVMSDVEAKAFAESILVQYGPITHGDNI